MITRSIKTIVQKNLLKSAGRLRISVPDKLEEVTLGQMMRLQEKTAITDLEAISILSGIEIEELKNVTNMADLQVFGSAVLSLSQQIKNLYNSDKIPKRVSFYLDEEIKTVDVIHNLSVEPAGAFMAAREIIAEEINTHIIQHGGDNWQETFNPSLKACCLVLSNYFYCRVTGELYNEYEADEFCSEIKKIRVTEALPIAKHFFTCYPNLSMPKTNCFQQLLQFWKRKPVSDILTSSSI